MVDRKRKAALLGFGFDGTDGHVRVTRGESFQLIGGSEETHGEMQEQCIKFDEKIKQRGKELSELGRQEFLDIARECDMNVPE